MRAITPIDLAISRSVLDVFYRHPSGEMEMIKLFRIIGVATAVGFPNLKRPRSLGRRAGG